MSESFGHYSARRQAADVSLERKKAVRQEEQRKPWVRGLWLLGSTILLSAYMELTLGNLVQENQPIVLREFEQLITDPHFSTRTIWTLEMSPFAAYIESVSTKGINKMMMIQERLALQ